jgi:hypothetical protein
VASQPWPCLQTAQTVLHHISNLACGPAELCQHLRAPVRARSGSSSCKGLMGRTACTRTRCSGSRYAWGKGTHLKAQRWVKCERQRCCLVRLDIHVVGHEDQCLSISCPAPDAPNHGNCRSSRVCHRQHAVWPVPVPCATQVTFIPKVPRHPHCYSNGHICLDMLYGGWVVLLGHYNAALACPLEGCCCL